MVAFLCPGLPCSLSLFHVPIIISRCSLVTSAHWEAVGAMPQVDIHALLLKTSAARGAQNPARAQLVFSLCRCICTLDLSALVLSTCCLSFLFLNFIFHRVSGPSLQDCALGAHPPGAAGRRSVFLLPKAALFLSWALCVRCDPGKLL